VISFRFSRRSRTEGDTRRRMIRETGLYLSWALKSEHRRIPVRRVDQGGYSQLMKQPGGRADKPVTLSAR